MVAHLHHTRRVIVTVVVLFCCAFFLTSYSKRNPQTAQAGARLVAGLVSPFQLAYGTLQHKVSTWWDNYITLVEVAYRNEKLQAELAELKVAGARLHELEAENNRLRALLRMTEALQLKGVGADIISYNPSGWVHTVVVDRGSETGIRPGFAVLTGNGLVGQVGVVTPNTAHVLLITDHSSGVDAVLQDGRVRGVVEGAGMFQAHWNYVLSEEEVQIGDQVVTSGVDSVFPKGILIGTVANIVKQQDGRLFQEITVQPAVDFARLESVLIVNK